MEQTQGLRLIFVKEKSKCTEIEKTLSRSTLALLAVYQLAFGFNFGFAKVVDQRYRKPIKMCTILMGIVMLILLFVGYSHISSEDGRFTLHIYWIQYIPTFFILFSSKYTLCEFLKDLVNIKEHVKYGRIGLIAWIALTLNLAKLGSSILYCFYTYCTDSRQTIANILLHISIIALDAIPVANLLLFYYVSVLVKNLKDTFRRQEIDSNSLVTTYKSLADCFDKFRSTHDSIFVWGFLIQSSKWMLMIWSHLVVMKSSQPWLLYACSYAWAGHITMEICVPAIFAEMITVHAEAIKAVIHERLLVENDEAKTRDLARVLRYLKARPLLDKAWRLVPLDLRLPIVMLSMSTTYLIVIIQFTHLFD